MRDACFSKIVDEAAGSEDVHSGEVVCAGGVVVVAVDGEDGKTDVEIRVFEIDSSAVHEHRKLVKYTGVNFSSCLSYSSARTRHCKTVRIDLPIFFYHER